MGDAIQLRAAILVISETAYSDPSTDKCIPSLREVFANEGGGKFNVEDSEIVPDDVLQIQRAITQRTDGDALVNLIVMSGGTGFAVKDVTPEVIIFLQSSLPVQIVTECRQLLHSFTDMRKV